MRPTKSGQRSAGAKKMQRITEEKRLCVIEDISDGIRLKTVHAAVNELNVVTNG